MEFLENNWDTIKPRVSEGITHEECVAEAFMRPWVHDNANMDMIVQALLVLQPDVVMELGTFEGYGTYKIAKAMSEYGGGKLYTFDVGHSPANSLGEPYGCAPTFEEGPIVDWKNFPEKHVCARGWKSWGLVIEKRNKRLEEMKGLKNVEVEFIEGLTYDTLPEVMPRIGEWDFCFQDTLHTTEHIIREWKLFKDYSKIGSIVVFDDIVETQNFEFLNWFAKNEKKKWSHKHTKLGHGQLWAERIR